MYSDWLMSFKSLSEREVEQHKFKTKLCVKERSYTVLQNVMYRHLCYILPRRPNASRLQLDEAAKAAASGARFACYQALPGHCLLVNLDAGRPCRRECVALASMAGRASPVSNGALAWAILTVHSIAVVGRNCASTPPSQHNGKKQRASPSQHPAWNRSVRRSRSGRGSHRQPQAWCRWRTIDR